MLVYISDCSEKAFSLECFQGASDVVDSQNCWIPVILELLEVLFELINYGFQFCDFLVVAVSADMADAMHPSQACPAGQEDAFHQPRLHDGLVLKHDPVHNNSNDIVTSFLFREVAKRAAIPIQVCNSWQLELGYVGWLTCSILHILQ